MRRGLRISSLRDLPEGLRAGVESRLAPRAAEADVSKMRNRAVRIDGKRFASGLEADRYLELKALRAAGEVRYFLRQVPFELAPQVTYRCDFMVVWNRCQIRELSGNELPHVTYEDTKGFLTDTSRMKIKMVAELYGVRVQLLRRQDVQRMRS